MLKQAGSFATSILADRIIRGAVGLGSAQEKK